MPDDPSRIAHGNGICRDILRHHSSSADNGIFPNGHTGENGSTGADSGIFLDDHRLAKQDPMLFFIVVVGQDLGVGGNADVVLNDHAAAGHTDEIVHNGNMVSAQVSCNSGVGLRKSTRSQSIREPLFCVMIFQSF
jgi:hypothetical protein